MKRKTFKTSRDGCWETRGPFKGDLTKWTEAERHGDFVVMTDGLAFRVLDQSCNTLVWRSISAISCAQYAKAMDGERARSTTLATRSRATKSG